MPARYVQVHCSTRDAADLSVGNPLTYHDARSHILGRNRFYHQEGLFGAIVNRFRYLVSRSFRRPQEFELGLVIIFCFSHVLTQEYFARKRVDNAAIDRSAGNVEPPDADMATAA